MSKKWEAVHYPSGPAFVHFGGEVRAEAGRWRTGRGVRGGGAQTRRAGDARCGGLAGQAGWARRGVALALIRVWGLGAARLLYELTLRGFAWSKTPPIYGILLLSGRHFL